MPPLILVVEDEGTIREMLVEGLELEGWRVVAAADGVAGLARFRDDRPDLVLLDLMLPGISGVELCRAIRAESAVPIVMVTARASEVDRIVGLELGADDYVTKPFSLRELVARIRAVLRRTGGAAPPAAEPTAPAPVAVGRIVVDLDGRRVLRDGRPVALRPQAFELLAFLLRNRGRVFTREQLLEHAWGSDFPGETRTVDVHVRRLRVELEDDPARPRLLETVRGVGYVLRRD